MKFANATESDRKPWFDRENALESLLWLPTTISGNKWRNCQPVSRLSRQRWRDYGQPTLTP